MIGFFESKATLERQKSLIGPVLSESSSSAVIEWYDIQSETRIFTYFSLSFSVFTQFSC